MAPKLVYFVLRKELLNFSEMVPRALDIRSNALTTLPRFPHKLSDRGPHIKGFTFTLYEWNRRQQEGRCTKLSYIYRLRCVFFSLNKRFTLHSPYKMSWSKTSSRCRCSLVKDRELLSHVSVERQEKEIVRNLLEEKKRLTLTIHGSLDQSSFDEKTL